jgi:hypothetical protein
MVGGNEILINHATMHLAMEFWLKNQVLGEGARNFEVIAVRAEENGANQQFRVMVLYEDKR